MADLTIHELQNETSTPADDDYMVLDGATAGTRKTLASALATWVHNGWAAFVNAITPLKTGFASGDKIPVVNGSTATAMGKDDLLTETAQNALAGNVAPAFIPNSTNAVAGKLYVYGGNIYKAKENYNGSWDSSKFTAITEEDALNIELSGINGLSQFSTSTAYPELGKFLRKIKCYLPDSDAGHEFIIYSMSIQSDDSFLIWLYDLTDGAATYWATTDAYATLPTSGIEQIKFTRYRKGYPNPVNANDVYFVVEVDWSYYSGNHWNTNLNSGVSLKCESIRDYSPAITKGLNAFTDDRYLGKNSFLKCLKSFNLYLDEGTYDLTKTYAITVFGFVDETTFTIRIRNVTDGTWIRYVTKTYASIPTSGIEHIVLKHGRTEVYDLVVDWSKYNSSDVLYEPTPLPKTLKPIFPLPLTQEREIPTIVGNNYDLSQVTGSFVLKGTFYLNRGITLADDVVWIGLGCTVTCNASAYISLGNNNRIEGINFVGPWEPERTEQANGYVPLTTIANIRDGVNLYNSENEDKFFIYINNNKVNANIINCKFKGFNSCVIYADGGAHRDEKNPMVSGCYFVDCWGGIYVKAEFTRIVNNEFFRVIIGTYVFGGNTMKSGNIYKCCDCAVFYPSGSNNGAHGENVGCEMAHCFVAGIYIKTIPEHAGEVYTGCHIVDSPIIADEAYSLLIVGGRLDTYVVISSGSKNAIICNIVGADWKYSHPYWNVPSDTKVTMNTPIDAATEQDVNLN